jgi:anti-sigma factor RsiW
MTRKQIKKTKNRKIELNCKKTTSIIMDYITEALKPDIALEFEKHLSICPDCVAFLNTYKKTMHVVHSFYNKKSQKMKKGLKKSLRAKINKREF